MILHTVNRDPRRSLNAPEPSNLNHLPTNELATYYWKYEDCQKKETCRDVTDRIVQSFNGLDHGESAVRGQATNLGNVL
jgi:hypothetical protein